MNVTPVSTFLENYSAAIKLCHGSVMIVASFLVDLFMREPSYLKFRPSMVAAVALYVALKFDLKHFDTNMYSYNINQLSCVMNTEEFGREESQECKVLIQQCLLEEMKKPTRALMLKYGNTRAQIYKFKPVMPPPAQGTSGSQQNQGE